MTSTETIMKTISAEILALTKSPLYAFRTENSYQPVIGEGAIDAHIMFVGEAPGETEAKSGKPFCGRAGKVLDLLLASISMDRELVYVTNLVKDRPPGNRDPEQSEIALYGPFLERQITLIKPQAIVTLGRHSMNYVFEKYGLVAKLETISKIHGKKFEGVAPYGKVTVIPMYHPAFALYNPVVKKEMLKDFKPLKKYA